MSRTPEEVLVRPVVTEESSRLQFEEDKYTFEVVRGATKPEIQRAVQDLFEVEVLSVRTMNYRGKKRRVGTQEGRKRSWKKAIVELPEGQTIELFEGV